MIRKTIKELVEELDPEFFWQIHRSTIVNVNAIAAVQRRGNGTLEVRLKRNDKVAAGECALCAPLQADVVPARAGPSELTVLPGGSDGYEVFGTVPSPINGSDTDREGLPMAAKDRNRSERGWNTVLRYGIAVALIAVGLAAAPYPARAAEPPVGGIAVGVPSPDTDGKTTVLTGMLWWPEGTPRAGIVFANGSGGWRDAREGYYGRMLSALGYAVLAVDSFGARGIADTVADQSSISLIQMTRDAFAARRLLVARGIAPDHTAIMGGSRGGTVALLAADRTFLPAEADRFQVVIAFYPGCNFRVRAPKPSGALFMLLGERDNYTGVKPCQDIAEDYEKAGGKLMLKIYPDSMHAFDGDPAHSRMFHDFMAETFIECVASVEEDGTLVFEGQRFDADRGFADMVAYARRRPCAGHGVIMGTNRKQREIAARDVIEFLNATFSR